MSHSKVVSLAFSLLLAPALLLAGCAKSPEGTTSEGASRSSSPSARRSGGKGVAAALLTKEEVGAVLGQPVVSIEGTGTDLTYKTDVLLLETTIEVESRGDVADAVQSMQGARKATGFLGGEPEAVPNLGDEAFFGAMSFLYVRKGESFITITPPNLQQVAAQKAGARLREAKLGSDEQLKALEELKKLSQNDPSMEGLKQPDAGQGAVAVVKASSKEQGTEAEAQSRAMALALAAKVLAKL